VRACPLEIDTSEAEPLPVESGLIVRKRRVASHGHLARSGKAHGGDGVGSVALDEPI
jgi:hypothetical protein